MSLDLLADDDEYPVIIIINPHEHFVKCQGDLNVSEGILTTKVQALKNNR